MEESTHQNMVYGKTLFADAVVQSLGNTKTMAVAEYLCATVGDCRSPALFPTWDKDHQQSTNSIESTTTEIIHAGIASTVFALHLNQIVNGQQQRQTCTI
jgi:hypothetical protein